MCHFSPPPLPTGISRVWRSLEGEEAWLVLIPSRMQVFHDCVCCLLSLSLGYSTGNVSTWVHFGMAITLYHVVGLLLRLRYSLNAYYKPWYTLISVL